MAERNARRKVKEPEKRSNLERAWFFWWQALAPEDLRDSLEFDWYFHSERFWQMDYAHPAARVAVELEGVTAAQVAQLWNTENRPRSRHLTLSGYDGDCEKYNAAQSLGWIVLRYTRTMLDKDAEGCVAQAVGAIRERLTMKGSDDSE